MEKFGSGIQDGKNWDPSSGMEKIRIRDKKNPGSATLPTGLRHQHYLIVSHVPIARNAFLAKSGQVVEHHGHIGPGNYLKIISYAKLD
jgi:hypothetical protein